MTEIEGLDPFQELSLTPEQIDAIVHKNIDAGTILYNDKNDLYVPPSMRNDITEPTWEYKMNAFGRIIQEKMN